MTPMCIEALGGVGHTKFWFYILREVRVTLGKDRNESIAIQCTTIKVKSNSHNSTKSCSYIFYLSCHPFSYSYSPSSMMS